ncbi:unnamed protein product [Symbiodinium pilosum]|uniref:PH domain-containing protein n=1 Tax=Symbiodinium pilosum TaxID=2952 RepID=A0A812JP78_SYMPI|nr:unnamed protein product [Symbiodinium pilosum]
MPSLPASPLSARGLDESISGDVTYRLGGQFWPSRCFAKLHGDLLMLQRSGRQQAAVSLTGAKVEVTSQCTVQIEATGSPSLSLRLNTPEEAMRWCQVLRRAIQRSRGFRDLVCSSPLISPRGASPSPRGASPSPRGASPSPRGASPSPRSQANAEEEERMDQLQAQLREKEAAAKALGEAQNAAMARADAAADAKQEAEVRAKLAEQSLRNEQGLRDEREKKLQAQAEEEAAKCKQQVGDMQIELATQKAEVSSLQTLLSTEVEERKVQQAEMQSHTHAHQALQDMISALEKQLSDVQRRKAAAEHRFAAEEACRKALEERCAGAEKRHHQDEQLAESLAASLREAKQCLASAEAGREAVADQALVDERAARRIAETAQKAAQDEAESLQARLSSAEAKANEAEARAQELQKRLAAIESRAKKAEQAPDSPRKKAEQAELARKEVESRNHELQKRLAAAEAKAKKAEQLEEARKEAETRAQEMQQRLSYLEAEMTAVQQAALACKEAEKHFQDVQKEETKKMEAIQVARRDAEARVSQLQNQVSSLETELARAKDTESLQEVHLAVQHDAEARATDLQRQLSGMETELKEVQQLRSDKEKAEEKVRSLEERLLVLEEGMASAKAATEAQAQDQVQDMQRRLEAANRRLLAEENCRKVAEERGDGAEKRLVEAEKQLETLAMQSPRRLSGEWDVESPKPVPSEASMSTETYENHPHIPQEGNDMSQLHALLAAAELKASEESRARHTAQKQLIQAIKAATAAGAKMKAAEMASRFERGNTTL